MGFKMLDVYVDEATSPEPTQWVPEAIASEQVPERSSARLGGASPVTPSLYGIKAF
jgi:hypothetical protein